MVGALLLISASLLWKKQFMNRTILVIVISLMSVSAILFFAKSQIANATSMVAALIFIVGKYRA